MAQSKLPPEDVRKALALSEWLYGFFLRVYPETFRRTYGLRMAYVFRDSCRDALQQQGWASLIPFWLQTLSDLVSNAYLERWQLLKEETGSMARTQNFPPRLWIALAATVIAFAISLVASLNLYMLEDASSLTRTAYSASPLLRFSYDGVYLSALAAGVAVCAIVGYAFVQHETHMIVGLIVVTLLVAFGGFGGLLVHHMATFLVFFVIFIALTLTSLLLGRAVATRMMCLRQQPATVLGACVSAGSILLVNVVALILHTLTLNMVSHALYMQGQIGGTHLNFSLIVMSIAFLTMIACIVTLGRALRFSSQQS